MAGPARPAIIRTPGNGHPAPAPPSLLPRNFDLPSLLYTTLAVAFGLFALARLLAVIVLVRDAPEVGMAVLAEALSTLAGVGAAGALVFGGLFGRGLPGWARVTMACVAAAILAGTFAA